jgi:phage shock protein A
MNRDYPLASTIFSNKEAKVKRLQKREDKLVYKGNKAVDEGREKKADRLLGRAARTEDRKIRLSEKK